MRIQPTLVVSRDPRTQNAYVLMLRKRRIAVLGVATCGDAVEMRRHIQLAAILVDVASSEDWDTCRLLRRACNASVIAVTRVSSDIDCAAARRESGCVATIAARRGHAAIIRVVNTILGRIPTTAVAVAATREGAPAQVNMHKSDCNTDDESPNGQDLQPWPR